MSEQAPDRFWSGIQITKVAAGTLAAVSAAVIGSFLGVAGTLAGAAVASIVGSLGTEIYQRSLDRGAKKLQTLAPTFVKAPAAVGTPPVPAASEEDSPSHTVPEEERAVPAAAQAAPEEGRAAAQEQPAASGKALPWRRIGVAAALLFVLAIASLSVVELLAGRSVASMVGNDTGGRTTLSSVVRDDPDAGKPAPVESAPAGEASPTEEPTATTDPTDAPSTEPSGDATTDPATEPTTEPTATEAPEQTGPAEPEPEPEPNQQQEQLEQQEPGTSQE
jgi:hypothetical protein